MKKTLFLLAIFFICIETSFAQTNPAITAWIQNHDGTTGRHYIANNPTPIDDGVLANVQSVDYSDNWVYVSATGIPSYITGPFLDNNPSLATDQQAIYKISLNPTQNTGTPTNTTGGNIGVFVNGVSLFDGTTITTACAEVLGTHLVAVDLRPIAIGIEMPFLQRWEVLIAIKPILLWAIITTIKTPVLLI